MVAWSGDAATNSSCGRRSAWRARAKQRARCRSARWSRSAARSSAAAGTRLIARHDPTAHAEILAMREAAEAVRQLPAGGRDPVLHA